MSMEVNMLKAILKMLEKPSKTRVDCAIAVLQEVIQYLENKRVVADRTEIIPGDPLDPSNTDEGLSIDALDAKKDLLS